MAIGLVLLGAAFAITAYNILDEMRANAEAEKLAGHIEEIISEKSVDENAIPDYILNPQMDMPTVEIDGHRYIGVLEFSSMDISLPVMSEWSYPHLKISPCRYKGSAYLDNFIIAGHNYSRQFGVLKSMDVGDNIVFTDMDGNVFKYVVAQKEVLSQNSIEEMESGSWDITLFTCTFDGRSRVTIRCKKENEN